jgi:sec-independent protein translocase protein TatA
MSIGIWQVLLVLLLVVLFFGKGKISDLMGDFAKGIKNFKKGLADDDTPRQADQKAVASSAEKPAAAMADDKAVKS